MKNLPESNLPMIGAQIFIEPGQSPTEIDTWFSVLRNHGMKICRIRMFESYMHDSVEGWNFELFDLAFQAAEKYDIKILATLFPYTSFEDVGGFKFPKTKEHLKSIAEYINEAVTHFKNFKSCYGWVLINEPGAGNLPNEELTQEMFADWKEDKTTSSNTDNRYNVLDFHEEQFLVDHNIWYLKWLANEIRKYDRDAHLHVNNHAIFENVAEYEFSKWREALDSLGGSAHASWHFGYFIRSQYAVAMSANCEIIRSGAGDLPWQMTEIQGGNNIYSGFNPMCPTKEEIFQWLCITIGSGSTGGIFWCLNSRASGFEAGEWAMVNFQNEPSDRLLAASSVIDIISENQELFEDVDVVESGINLLYIRESLWVEKKLQMGGGFFEGRAVGGVMKSVLGYYEALCELGIQCNVKEIGEFNFSKDTYIGETIILAHQISIPSQYWGCLENFVGNGGKLIVDGLTGYYDENAHCIMNNEFPLSSLFGGSIKEFKVEADLFELDFPSTGYSLPAHMWKGSIKVITSTPLVVSQDEVLATRNTFGNGDVLWIPSLVGLGSRLTEYGNLIQFLLAEAEESISTVPIRFKEPKSGMLMKMLKSANSFITILINKDSGLNVVEFVSIEGLNPAILFSSNGGFISKGNMVSISPEETLVIKWK